MTITTSCASTTAGCTRCTCRKTSIDPELNNDDVEVLAHDSHWVPMDPRGGLIDWEEIAKWIARSPLDLPPDFEVGIYGDTPEEEFRQLVECRKTAEKFYQMVLAHKEKG